jgi:hypothetical protein
MCYGSRNHNYHLIRESVSRGDEVVAKIKLAENLANLFCKTIPQYTCEVVLNENGCQMYAKLELRTSEILLGCVP